MKLEKQIEKLAELGLVLNQGISIDSLLTSYPREEYEKKPFDLILFLYGDEVEEEPWGRYICDSAWNFDAECIEDHGDYVAIVKQFHRITGKKKRLEDLSDSVDLEAEKAYLSYTLDGIRREFDIRVDNDWVDPETAEAIMDDMCEEGYGFYAKDNGQAAVWFYMTPANAKILNALAANVFGLDPKPWWKF